MTSTRNFAYAALLAFTALNLAPSLASAQESASGKFTLTHDVHWGNAAKVLAGDYEFSFDPDASAHMLRLSKISGTPAAYMLLVPVVERAETRDLSRLVLQSTPDGSYVSAMQLPESGMTLYFTVPTHPVAKQIARAATTTAALGQ
jgi:hypothetical protein